MTVDRAGTAVHRHDDVRTISDLLPVDDVVPGWKMPLAEVFEE